MTGSEVGMLFVLVATAVWATVRLPPLHPAQLWAVPWAAAAVLFALQLFPYRELSLLATALAAGATLAFVAGTVVGERRLGRRMWGAASEDLCYGLVARAAIGALVLTAVLLIAFLWQTIQRFGVHDALISSVEVRIAIGDGDTPVTIKFVYAAIAASALSGVTAGVAPTKKRRIAWALAASAAVASLYFSTGRSTMVYGLIIAATAYLVTRPRLPRRSRFLLGVGTIACIAVIVHILGGLVIGKTYANNRDLRETPSFFSSHAEFRTFALPYQYASASTAALGIQVDASTPLGTSHGCAVFSEACSFLGRLGADLEPVRRIRPFTRPPLPWNTYTSLDAPLQDVGVIGAIPLMAILGILVGGLWGAARVGRRYALVAYPIAAAAVITAYSQFAFTAPHLLGAIIIASGLLVASAYFGRRAEARSRPSQSHKAVSTVGR
jgi:oligosaccharide repeat unit polymerase